MSRRIILIALLAAGGCATVRPRERFSEVEKVVTDRSTLAVHWNTGGAADDAVKAKCAALLAAPLDADGAAQVALFNNHHLQAAYEALGVAQADLVAAGLLKNPRFDGSFRFVEEGQSSTIDLGIAFDFIDLFFINARKRIAAAEFEVVKTNLTVQVLGAVAQTKAAFYELQAADQAVELQSQIEQATAASADFAQRLRAAGNNRPLDVAQEQSLHEDAVIALDAAKTNQALAREKLARRMGVAGGAQTFTLAGRLPELATAPPLPVDGEKTALAQSLTLSAARGQIDVELKKFGITKPFAAFDGATVGVSSERDDGDWEVGPAIGIPLPIFDQGQPAVARAESAIRQARERYHALQVDVASDARTALLRVKSLHDRAERYRTVLLPLKQTILSDTQLQYNAMQVGPFQLLQAKREQMNAASAYVEVLRDYWLARTTLELILRGGTPGESVLDGGDR